MDSTNLLSSTIDILIVILPIALPIFLAVILFDFWLYYKREKFIFEQETVLLQIKPPLDVFKTPLAMELFINGLHQIFGEATWKDVYWKGSVRPWFSLELASNNGELGFYIWTRKGIVGYIESQIYSQYPGIEVLEVEDYCLNFEYNSEKHKMWALEYKFAEDDSIPIKTYVDYGLDKPSKDEEKVDPITPTLEFLGSAREGEKIWIQIILRAHKKEDRDPKKWFGKTDLWADNYKKEVEKIRKTYEEKAKDGEAPKIMFSTEGQTERIRAIERSQGKLPFDVGIRGIYIAEKDIFNPTNIGGLIGSFKQYSSANLNGFKPGNKTAIDHWWQDPLNRKIKKMEKQFIVDYKERAYFFRPFMGKKRKKLVMNAEELATVFHFPGSVALTPTLDRVKSRKSTAPSDLPV